ncbi:MAG: tyrosine--tRNA ligase [Methanophagales archaeon ANME-1-THS]|nr:MAG: tyrosine--tRNA ligase [Methanophagales archaeon ANME-1-THS]
MNGSESLRVLKMSMEEIITEDEFEAVLSSLSVSGKKPRAYVGFEPSGSVHIGHLPILILMRELQRAGFHVIILLADLHAYLNEKGSFEQIRRTAEYNKRCFVAAGLGKETEFILGSSYQMDEAYMLDVLRLATITTEKRAKRSMDELSRSKEDRKVSQMIYPLMQAVDIKFLDIDVAVGGIDQRKIHMLAREHLPKLGFRAPICIHTPLLIGLDGEKMSSSKGNYIAVDEPAERVEQKLMGAFCPPQITEGNPVLQIYKHMIFLSKETGTVVIERSDKHGGDVSYEGYNELERDYVAGELHPLDVKTNAVRYLNAVLEPIRTRMQ